MVIAATVVLYLFSAEGSRAMCFENSSGAKRSPDLTSDF